MASADGAEKGVPTHGFRMGLVSATLGFVACIGGEGVDVAGCCDGGGRWVFAAYYLGVGWFALGVLLLLKEYRVAQRGAVERCAWVGMAMSSTACIVMLAGDAYTTAAVDAVGAVLFGIGAGCLRKSGRIAQATSPRLYDDIPLLTLPGQGPPPAVAPGPSRPAMWFNTLAWACVHATLCGTAVALAVDAVPSAHVVYGTVGVAALAMLVSACGVACTYRPYNPASRDALWAYLTRTLAVGVAGYVALLLCIVGYAAARHRLAEPEAELAVDKLSLAAVWATSVVLLAVVYLVAGAALCIMNHRYGC